ADMEMGPRPAPFNADLERLLDVGLALELEEQDGTADDEVVSARPERRDAKRQVRERIGAVLRDPAVDALVHEAARGERHTGTHDDRSKEPGAVFDPRATAPLEKATKPRVQHVQALHGRLVVEAERDVVVARDFPGHGGHLRLVPPPAEDAERPVVRKGWVHFPGPPIAGISLDSARWRPVYWTRSEAEKHCASCISGLCPRKAPTDEG